MGDVNESIVYMNDNNVEFRVNLEVRVNDKGELYDGVETEAKVVEDEERKEDLVTNGDESIQSVNQKGLLIANGITDEEGIIEDENKVNENGEIEKEEVCSVNNNEMLSQSTENVPDAADSNRIDGIPDASEKDLKVNNESHISTQSLKHSSNTTLDNKSVNNMENNGAVVYNDTYNESETVFEDGQCDTTIAVAGKDEYNNDLITPESDIPIEQEEIVVEKDLIYDDFLVLSTEHVSNEPAISGSLDILNEYADINLSDLSTTVAVDIDKDDVVVTTAAVVALETVPENVENSVGTENVTENTETEEILVNTDTDVIVENDMVKTAGSRTSLQSKRSYVEKTSTNCFCIRRIPRNKFKFPSNNNILITLKYNETTKDLLGNIHSPKGLGYDETQSKCPIKIRFHILILPQCRYRLKTKWVHASLRSLAWKFYMGPFKDENFDPAKKNIRFRLYGKSKVFSRCYGECFVPLLEAAEAEKSVEFERDILGKGVLKGMNVKSRR